MFKTIALSSAIQLKDECSCSVLANQKILQTLTDFHKIIMKQTENYCHTFLLIRTEN